MNLNSFTRVRVQKKYFFEFGENDRVQRVRVQIRVRSPGSLQEKIFQNRFIKFRFRFAVKNGIILVT